MLKQLGYFYFYLVYELHELKAFPCYVNLNSDQKISPKRITLTVQSESIRSGRQHLLLNCITKSIPTYQTMRTDWDTFERSWQHIFLQNQPKILVNNLGHFEKLSL